MILAGVDEAGYGPLLGPLVVGCCAFEFDEPPPDASADECPPLPCLWKRLRKQLRKKRSANGRTLHVNDSKLVYSSGDLSELERSVLSLIGAWKGLPDSLPGVLSAVAPHVQEQLSDYPWYAAHESEIFPIENEAALIGTFANGLRLECERTSTRCVHLGARVVLEREFNRMVGDTRNKSTALFSIAAIHLDHLLRNFGERGLVIICDRQGGRAHYGNLLRLMFEDWALEVVSERDPSRSEYKLTRNGHCVRIIFTEKAETQCLPVAVGSMLCKYLREALMRRFNAYWALHVENLSPTAGYYGDGARFLNDIAPKRVELGITDELLVRCR